jgi:transcriptional regulator with XRE-family HTH domain
MPLGVSNFSPSRLTARRKRLGWSQMELAVEAGLNYQVIGILERGVRPPTPVTLSKLARALGCRESALLYRRDEAA